MLTVTLLPDRYFRVLEATSGLGHHNITMDCDLADPGCELIYLGVVVDTEIETMEFAHWRGRYWDYCGVGYSAPGRRGITVLLGDHDIHKILQKLESFDPIGRL